jgi:hypothetical protein
MTSASEPAISIREPGPILQMFPASHYDEKARWALDAQGHS